MRIRLLESAASPTGLQYATTFVIDDHLAVDAGCLGMYGTPDDQARIRDVVLTHSHADHVATLPIFVENAYEGAPEGVRIWGNTATLKCLRQDIFNDRIWPDFERLSPPGAPFLTLHELVDDTPIELAGLRITPVRVDHTVRTFGLLVEDGEGAALIVSDTAPTRRIWQVANATRNLRIVFLEASFPSRMQDLARDSMHLTPTDFAAELRKLDTPVRTIAVHMKARYREEIAAELRALELDTVEIGVPGMEYTT